MKKKSRIFWFYFVLGVIVLSGPYYSVALCEEKYPTRPVEIYCPLPPGGAVDLTMRALTSVAGKYLGQPLVPMNRAGGGGTVGTAFVASAKPDGYTILISSSTSLLAKPLLEKLPYSPDDFVAIGRITMPFEIIYVLNTSPWKTLIEFIDDAKKNPGKFRYASTGGNYNTEHILFASLEKKTGIKLVHVPTGGGGPSLAMVLGGHVETNAGWPIQLKSYISAGTIRGLAVWGPERLKFEELKGIPTLDEMGLGIQNIYWISVFAPKNTPKPIVQQLRAMLKQSVEDEAFKTLMTRNGEEIKYMGGEEFEIFFRDQRLNLGKLLKDMK